MPDLALVAKNMVLPTLASIQSEKNARRALNAVLTREDKRMEVIHGK
jgi:hypothetical protein